MSELPVGARCGVPLFFALKLMPALNFWQAAPGGYNFSNKDGRNV